MASRYARSLALVVLVLLMASEPVFAQTNVDYDTDDDNYIEVASHAQLNAIRYDLNGDGAQGTVSASDWGNYTSAFSNAATGMGCAATCVGYELTANIDLDTDGDGSADSGDAYYNSGAGYPSAPTTTQPLDTQAISRATATMSKTCSSAEALPITTRCSEALLPLPASSHWALPAPASQKMNIAPFSSARIAAKSSPATGTAALAGIPAAQTPPGTQPISRATATPSTTCSSTATSPATMGCSAPFTPLAA